MKKPDEPVLTVRIISPTKTHYAGKAVSVSATNKVGPFDILADHANFFSILDECQVVVNTSTQNFTFPITQGIIKVANNAVTLFADIEPAYLNEDTEATQIV